MNDDNAQQHNTIVNPPPHKKVNPPHTLYRGVYRRVAEQLGVDPSYVSRVARGERVSAEIQKFLTAELNRIGALNHQPDGRAPQEGHSDGDPSIDGIARLDGHASSDGKTKGRMPQKNGRLAIQADQKVRRPTVK